MRYYAGIGSRLTPKSQCADMSVLAWHLGWSWILRSGRAPGADRAFEQGAGDSCEIFRPEDATPAAFDHAAKYHPDWGRLGNEAMALHARNSMIMLGRNLDTPVKVVICWTPSGAIVGGTGQAMRIALAYHIPIFNLYSMSVNDVFRRMAKL